MVLGAAWLLMIVTLVFLLSLARQSIVANLSTPAAQAQWQRWKDEETVRQGDPRAPVKRRTPKSSEPPTLVLMRDSFPAIIVAMSVVATLCFAFGVMSLRGLRQPH